MYVNASMPAAKPNPPAATSSPPSGEPTTSAASLVAPRRADARPTRSGSTSRRVIEPDAGR